MDLSEGLSIDSPLKALSRSELAALRQQKALNAQKNLFREYLAREVKFSEKSLARGYPVWNKILHDIKMKELKTELTYWISQADRIMDRKIYRIQKLADCLQIADDQHERSQSKHCQLIDYLISFCEHFISSLKDLYQSEATEMIDYFYRECIETEQLQAQFQQHYNNIYHTENIIIADIFQKQAVVNLELTEDLINTEITKRYQIQSSTIQKMTKLYQQLQFVFKELEASKINAVPKEVFDKLLERQKNYEKDHVRLTDIGEKSYSRMMELQKELTNLETDYITKYKELTSEKKYFIEKYWELKTAVKEGNKILESQITYVASESYEVIQKLKEFLKLLKLLLSYNLNTRKFLTQKEKIMPYTLSDKTHATISPSNSEENITLLGVMQEDPEDQTELLKNFVQQMAVAKNHVNLLREEKSKLIEQNEKYVKLLKDYCNYNRNMCY